nr:putative late blight resistance protein homolog R1A-4 [Ipomoea batatas]
MHSFCVREAQKEGIFCALNTWKLPRWSFSMFANSCRWLSLYTHKFDYYVLFRTNNPRSILFFNEDDDILVSFKLLRVLAFVPSSFLKKVPARLQDLVFLRYLSVTEWFEGLNYVVSTNRNLQTLVISGEESQFRAHASLPSVCYTHCRTRVYCRFPNIEKLEVFVFCINPFNLDNIDYLERLEILSISISFGRVVTLRKPSMLPSQLKKLRFNGTNLSERDLKLIGMLPQLEVLKLENVFRGEEWKVEKGLFVRLKFLLPEDKTLKQWMASDGSFPCLKHLVLRFCYCLEKMHFERKPKYLESIELQWCRPPLIDSAKRIQKQQRDKDGNYTFEIKIKGSAFMTDEEDSINFQMMNNKLAKSIIATEERRRA